MEHERASRPPCADRRKPPAASSTCRGESRQLKGLATSPSRSTLRLRLRAPFPFVSGNLPARSPVRDEPPRLRFSDCNRNQSPFAGVAGGEAAVDFTRRRTRLIRHPLMVALTASGSTPWLVER